jgi:type IV secretory pathway VirB10-like protein
MTRHLPRFICIAALLATHAAHAQEKPTAKGVADLEQAKREAVEADRAIRAAAPPEKKKAPALSAEDAALKRFDKAADAAFIDRSNTRIVDQYRSADGVVIERITYGGKSYCVTSSTVNYIPGILHDASRAREVTCPPANAGWVRK